MSRIDNVVTIEEILHAASEGATEVEVNAMVTVLLCEAGQKRVGKNIAGVLSDRHIMHFGIGRYVKRTDIDIDANTRGWKRVLYHFPPRVVRLIVHNKRDFMDSLTYTCKIKWVDDSESKITF
jgi:hypothetical protein